MVRSSNIRVRTIVYVGVDIGAGDAEIYVIYISFIMSVQYIEYVVPYNDNVQRQPDS